VIDLQFGIRQHGSSLMETSCGNRGDFVHILRTYACKPIQNITNNMYRYNHSRPYEITHIMTTQRTLALQYCLMKHSPICYMPQTLQGYSNLEKALDHSRKTVNPPTSCIRPRVTTASRGIGTLVMSLVPVCTIKVQCNRYANAKELDNSHSMS